MNPSMDQIQRLGRDLSGPVRSLPRDTNWTNPFETDPYGDPQPIKLDGIQARATLPEHRAWQDQNPALASYYRYRTPWDYRNQGAVRMGQGLARTIYDPNNWFHRLSNTGALTAGSVLGLGGTGLGWGLGKILELAMGQGRRSPNWSRTLALALGLGGAGLGLYSGHNHRKQASWANPETEIIQALNQDPTLSFSEKSKIRQVLAMLTRAQKEELSDLVRTVVGAGVGALIMRFLVGTGLGGQLAGAVAGGMWASRSRQNITGPTQTIYGTNLF